MEYQKMIGWVLYSLAGLCFCAACAVAGDFRLSFIVAGVWFGMAALLKGIQWANGIDMECGE